MVSPKIGITESGHENGSGPVDSACRIGRSDRIAEGETHRVGQSTVATIDEGHAGPSKDVGAGDTHAIETPRPGEGHEGFGVLG